MSKIRTISTGDMIRQYLEANSVSIQELKNTSGVSLKTISLLLNGKSKLSMKLAEAIHQLIPGISVEFLMTYDVKYQLQKEDDERRFHNEHIYDYIEKHYLKKLFPDVDNDPIELYMHGIKVFSGNTLEDGFHPSFIVNPQFSMANNPEEYASLCWLTATYSECLESGDILKFDSDHFKENFVRYFNKLILTTDYDKMKENMRRFCKMSGVNFFLRESIPNSRIKGVVFQDKEGHVFLFMSTLFRCVENCWFTFCHECLHIINGDYRNPNLNDVSSRTVVENEKYINEEAIIHILGEKALKSIVDLSKDQVSSTTMREIALAAGCPIGMVAEAVRFKKQIYDNKDVNRLTHCISRE
jgi:plasmid maintenance system antidote protein VapI